MGSREGPSLSRAPKRRIKHKEHHYRNSWKDRSTIPSPGPRSADLFMEPNPGTPAFLNYGLLPPCFSLILSGFPLIDLGPSSVPVIYQDKKGKATRSTSAKIPEKGKDWSSRGAVKVC